MKQNPLVPSLENLSLHTVKFNLSKNHIQKFRMRDPPSTIISQKPSTPVILKPALKRAEPIQEVQELQEVEKKKKRKKKRKVNGIDLAWT